MKDVRLELEGHSSAVMGRWLVRQGTAVQKGRVLARFTLKGGEHAGKGRDLVCPSDGVVQAILAKEATSVTQESVVCEIGSCLHEESYMNICSSCGADLEQVSSGGHVSTGDQRGGAGQTHVGMFGSVAHPSLRSTGDSLKRTQIERLNRLLASKRLVLVLDLDHTLLHTTLPRSEAQHYALERIESGTQDVYRLSVNAMTYYTKLRPNVRTFLTAMAELYELYVYTAGDRAYAENIARLLDYSGRWFSGRIVSRDDYADVPAEHKKLDKIFPFDEHWATALILDDNSDTWDHPSASRNPRENLIHVVKYNFWPRDLGETHNPVSDGSSQSPSATAAPEAEVPSSEDGGCAEFDAYVRRLLEADTMDRQLDQLQGLLTKVHTRFFQAGLGIQHEGLGRAVVGTRDVRVLIRQLYSSILGGLGLSFSGVFHSGTVPEHGREWKTAQSMGAMCDRKIVARTTHLVYVGRGEGGVTDKMVEAVHRGDVQVVSPEWVQACRSAWERVDEDMFRPRNWDAIRQEAEARAKHEKGHQDAKRRKVDDKEEKDGFPQEEGDGAEKGEDGDALLHEVMGLVGDAENVLSKYEGKGADADAGGQQSESVEGDDEEDDLVAALEQELEDGDGS